MTTTDNSSRRLRLVDEQQQAGAVAPEQDDEGVTEQQAGAVAPEQDDEGVTEQQAAAFAAMVANANQSDLERTLNQMNAEQLRSLALALASQINASEGASGEVADVGPDGICAIAIATAAQSFGTTRDAVLSADRHRAVTDARAVAMTAARRGGLTLPAIANYFGKDHTSVMYAQNKVANNPRLNAVCARIVDQLDEHYADPTRIPSAPESTRSTTLQLAALDQSRSDSARRHHGEDSQRISVSAAPAR